MTTPTPEQVAQWRKDAEKPYYDEYGIDNDARSKFAYSQGYLRAKTDMLDVIKLAATIAASNERRATRLALQLKTKKSGYRPHTYQKAKP